MSDYAFTNAYFKTSDPHPEYFGDFLVPEGWWSRRFEYFFAAQYAKPGMTVGDFGCGWHQRPLYGWLSNVCDFCYAVDSHPGVLDLTPPNRGVFVVADFAKRIDGIPEASLDRIFCISVLEELINYEMALSEFKRLLKPDGLIVLTLDAPYDPAKPAHDKYKGVNLDELEAAIARVGLRYEGSVNRTKPEDALFNADFNLCVFHAVLKNK